MDSSDQTDSSVRLALAAIRHLRRHRLAPYNPETLSRAAVEDLGRALLDQADRWLAASGQSSDPSKPPPCGHSDTPPIFERKPHTSRFGR